MFGGLTDIWGFYDMLDDIRYTPVGDGVHWTAATANWPDRAAAGAAVFDGKLWQLGGFGDGFVNLGDVWSSPVTDGINWTQATPAAPWSARHGLGVAAFDDGYGEKLWVLGGRDTAARNDVWYSTDGAAWTQVTASAPWSPRRYHGMAVFNGLLWVFGGLQNDNTPLNDIWYTPDGVSWTQATANAPWSPRGAFGVAVGNGRIWITGGEDPIPQRPVYLDDVWSSTDGITWMEATGAAAWVHRGEHTSVFADTQLWVLGGVTNNPEPGVIEEDFLNDIWYSRVVVLDTVTITQATYSPGPKRLTIEAKTTIPGATAVLMADGWGQMTYDTKKKAYRLTVSNVLSNPGTVTVYSSFGGEATSSVSQ